MKRHLTIALVLAGGLPLLAACNSGDDTATASPATVTVTSAAPVTVAAVPAPSSSMSAAPAPIATTSAAPASTSANVDFAMPDMTGLVLQDAQNQVQSHGVFYSTSHDLLGMRHQVLDRDWKVCDQNVTPGQRVTGNAEGQIDFGVVKLSERCP